MILTKALKHPRLQPLVSKLARKAPLCPWKSVLAPLNPSTRGIFPPVLNIQIIRKQDNLILLEFDGKARFWFPAATPVDAPLWSEYLVCFWESPTNHHHYFSKDVFISKGDIVVDCGACEGFFTRAALDAGAGKVICVEPSPLMANCLRLTFPEEIESGRVVIEEAALGSHHGRANFASSSENAFAGRMEASSSLTVEMITLDTLARRHGVPQFVKMDLEGAEFEALSGGIEMLAEAKPKLSITTYHYPRDFPAIRALLMDIRYPDFCPKGVSTRDGDIPRPVLIQAHASA